MKPKTVHPLRFSVAGLAPQRTLSEKGDCACPWIRFEADILYSKQPTAPPAETLSVSGLHPFARLVVERLRRRKDGSYFFDAQSIETLGCALDGCEADDTFLTVPQQLRVMALHAAEALNSKAASTVLLALAFRALNKLRARLRASAGVEPKVEYMRRFSGDFARRSSVNHVMQSPSGLLVRRKKDAGRSDQQ